MRERFRSVLGMVAAITLLLSIISGCSSTKFIPQGQYLLNDVNIRTDNKGINKSELKAQVKQKENLRILGMFKFHLGLYNLSSKDKTDDWLKRIGEAPVIYDETQTKRSLDHLGIYLQNKGYYHAMIRDTVIYHPRKPKADLIFTIRSGDPYLIRRLSYRIEDQKIRPAIIRDTLRQKVRPNDLFDMDKLDEERTRVTTLLQNYGYYKFTKDYIHYEVDTALNARKADITMVIKDADLAEKADTVVHHKRYTVRNYLVNTNYSPLRSPLRQTVTAPDTLRVPPYSIIYQDKLRYSPQLLDNLNRIQDHPYYSLFNVERTYRSLSQIKQFRMVNLNFDAVDSLGNDSIGVLDCNFLLSPLPRQGFSVDVEGTNSSGNLGVAGTLNYQHLNLFRGAEILDITLKGAFERQQAVVNESDLNFNTREYGIEGTLTLPKFLGPLNGRKIFNYQVPQTSFSLDYNYQRRPDYTRTITNFQYGYQWKSRFFRTHYLNIVDVNYVKLSAFNEDFLNSIKDLYIKSSYTDHLIAAMNYTLINNRGSQTRIGQYRYFKFSIESAGNLLSAVAALSGMEKTQATDTVTNEQVRYYEILNTRFAQYLKADLEYRYGYRIDQVSQVVGRIFLGVGLPYGNFDILPFERKYFAGGANGIRAWQVRTLGPGTYKAEEDAYPNQSADIKLEGNLEYRFPLVGPVEGAFFVDAGNIWAINTKDNREGALFKFDEFYKQLAIGTGTGLRFNFNYFIFRLDVGLKLRDPSLEAGKRFIIGNYSLNADHFNFSFAIGYPF